MKNLFLTTVVTLLIPLSAGAGSLEPPATPAPTMRTLEELKPSWGKKLVGAQRFVEALEGSAVLDKETGLVWEKSLDGVKRLWPEAIDYCVRLELGGRKGWRVPSVEELATLIDTKKYPALPSGHPFLYGQLKDTWFFWTSSTSIDDDSHAWFIDMTDGHMPEGNTYNGKKTYNSYEVWCVRAGK